MTPDRCPTCGQHIERPADPLVAACDMLVVRALELLGKRVVTRARRGRWEQTNLPWHQAHVLWQADGAQVNAALADAWTPVPEVIEEHGCCGASPAQLTAVLDRYVRDLVQMKMGHDVTELRYRLGAYLGVPTT